MSVLTAINGMERSCILNAETLSVFTADWGSIFHCGMVATKKFLSPCTVEYWPICDGTCCHVGCGFMHLLL